MTSSIEPREAASESRPFPEFERPPVVEVAVSVQFNAPILSTPQIILRWSQVRDRLPHYDQASPLPATIEEFGGPREPRLQVQLSDSPPSPRLLLMNEAKTAVVQIQENRFGYSWRKLKPEDEYPRYRKIRNDFEHELAEFREFLTAEGLAPLSADQCEVTYVNHVFPEEAWFDHSELGKVIPSVAPRLTEGFLPPPEEARYAARYVIRSKNDTPLARLHVSAEPGYLLANKTPLFLLKLTVRGAPQSPDTPGILETLDLGHEWIVRGFATLTSSEMHHAWGRTA